MVEKLLNEWAPGKLKNEKQYEKSLYEFLHDNLSEIQVTRQYARGRVRADIVVEDKVIIELKNNLDSTSKYQRLVGQISEYKHWPGPVFVVLCGTTDTNLRKELDNFIQRERLDDDEGVAIIQK